MGATEIVAVVGRESPIVDVAQFLNIPELIRPEGPVHITLLALDERQRARARGIQQALQRPEVAALMGDLNVSIPRPSPGVSSIAEFVGDRPDLLGDRGASPDDLEPVLFNAMSGPEEQRTQLEVLLDGYEVRGIHRSPEGLVYVTQRQALRRSHLFSALHFVRTASPSTESRARVDAERFHGLVGQTDKREPGDDAYRETVALLRLVGSERLKAQPDYHSASADLLERLGDHARAAELRRLIRLWLTNRLWSGNLVPEMVLHDEDHAVAVDRNVAFICEPIVRRFAISDDENWQDPSLRTEDLFTLAVAAWLHDCGHSSADIGASRFETDPTTVRELHGYLSFLRLTQGEPSLHGLPDDVRDKAALLCAHHQGKSSFDNAPAESLTELASKRGWKEAHNPGIPFNDHVHKVLRSTMDDVGKKQQSALLGRLGSMLAVLRVADAADVGVHRVPDHTSRTANHRPLVYRVIENYSQSVWAAERAAIAESASSQSSSQTAIVAATMDVFQRLVSELANTQHPLSETDAKEVVAKFAEKFGEDYDEGQERSESATVNSQAGKAAREAWKYASHVATQVGYYNSHARYEVVFPYLRREAKDVWRLCLAAQPSQSSLGLQGDEEKEFLEDIVLREFGECKRMRGRSPDPLKSGVRTRLTDLRIKAEADGLGFAWIKAMPSVESEANRKGDRLRIPRVRPGVSAVLMHGDEPVLLMADADGVVRPTWRGDDGQGDTPLRVSPQGDQLATLRDRLLTFHDLDLSGDVRATSAFNLDVADGRLLAVGGTSRRGQTGAALISCSAGTLAVAQSGALTPVTTDNCIAGILLQGYAVTVNASGAAHFHEIESDSTAGAVPWLEGLGVVDVDAVVIDERALVVALVERDGAPTILLAELHDDGCWEERTTELEKLGPKLDFSEAHGVALVRCADNALAIQVIRDDQDADFLVIGLDSEAATVGTGVAPQ